MGLYTTAGSKLYIGGVLDEQSADFVAGDFSGETWVEVTSVENLGTFGDTSQSISISIIGEARDKMFKGTRNAGNMEVVAGIDYADAGQIAVIAAEKTPYNYAFKVEFNDAPSGGTPSSRLFIAKVMSASEALDGANNVMKMNSTLAINSNIVRVAAAGP